MTRTVADAALILAIIVGRDVADETSLSAPLDDYASLLERGVKGIRIGIDENYIMAAASPEVTTAVLEAVRVLEKQGATVAKVELPDVQPAILAWATICNAEAAAAHEHTYPAKASQYGPGFRSVLETGAAIKGHEYAKANIIRERFTNRFQELFEQVDIVVCPSMGSLSLPATIMGADAWDLSGLGSSIFHFTAPFNLSRNPTLSQPCGQNSNGPPPSLQLIGRRLGEATLIQTGSTFERVTDWHKQRPEMRPLFD